jgi:peptidoglycan/xylan/chitin deacetylase (PgdA/CDA1 family)
MPRRLLRKLSPSTPETLENELSYLWGKGYVSISFDDLANHLTHGAPLPARPVIISFDDVWESQYHYALPILAKYGFRATFSYGSALSD